LVGYIGAPDGTCFGGVVESRYKGHQPINHSSIVSQNKKHAVISDSDSDVHTKRRVRTGPYYNQKNPTPSIASVRVVGQPPTPNPPNRLLLQQQPNQLFAPRLSPDRSHEVHGPLFLSAFRRGGLPRKLRCGENAGGVTCSACGCMLWGAGPGAK